MMPVVHDTNSRCPPTGGGILCAGLSELISAPEKRHVPNHLLDTKIYAGTCDNEIFHCRPKAIHFQGFHAGKKYVQKLRIINVSSECQRMHVIPPLSEIFRIHYMKLDSVVPGMYLEVTIEFIPLENVCYHDFIRIHSKAATNLTVPIHAYMSMNLSNFPKQIQFKPTQIGHSAIMKIPLKNDVAIDFGFQIVFIQSHSAFDIHPLLGVVPANNHIDILIKYSPTEYCTSCVKIQIIVSHFNCQLYTCSITGTSEPGISNNLKVKEIEKTSHKIVTSRNSSTLLGSSITKKQSDCTNVEEKEILKNGVRFPTNLIGHSVVSYVLSQKPGKLGVRDIKAIKVQADSSFMSKPMKDAVFQNLMSNNVAEEQRNQMRWGVKLGETYVTKSYHEDILNGREKTIEEYLVLKMKVDGNMEFERSTSQCHSNRIYRDANQLPLCHPTFDLFVNDGWQNRRLVTEKFVQAARKVIWISRATKGLKAINIYLKDGKHRSFKNTKTFYDENSVLQAAGKVALETIGRHMLSFSLPEITNVNQKDDMAADAFGILHLRETSIHLNHEICIYDLKVPLKYKLYHYNAHSFSSAVNKYIPKIFTRNLRKGSEYEVIPDTAFEETKLLDAIEIEDKYCSHDSKLTAPFFETKSYHPLHMFNPMPGICTHAELLPYLEIDDDYSLSPLSHAIPQRLEREGIISGIMNWKKFPSHGLLAMSSPSLYHVYVPRWSNAFGEEMLPHSPQLLASLPCDDQLEFDETEETSNVPNMVMVGAKFTMMEDIVGYTEQSDTSFPDLMFSSSINNPLSKHGLISRDKMKEEFNKYLQKPMNNLGNRVKSHVSQSKSKWALNELF